MRQDCLALVFALLAGCGSNDGGESSAALPVISSVAVLIGVCDDTTQATAGCKVVAAALTDPPEIGEGFAVAFTWTDAELFAPLCSAENSEEPQGAVLALTRPFDSFLSVRACVLNRSTGEFSEGLTAERFMPPAPLD